MSYDEEFVIAADTEEEVDDTEGVAVELEVVVDKVDSKKQRVETRRRIEDMLADKEYQKMYGDLFDDF